jgi:SWI/SNF-related matrix-associated actin-dependent regulator of chromatin subfamily A member 5
LGFLREFKHINSYFLIIVPKTVIPNWKNEFKKWLPQCRVLNLIATKDEREEIIKNQLQPGKFDVCLTTFEGVRLAMGPLLKFRWEYLIVDEAHKLKNEESQISQRLR